MSKIPELPSSDTTGWSKLVERIVEGMNRTQKKEEGFILTGDYKKDQDACELRTLRRMIRKEFFNRTE